MFLSFGVGVNYLVLNLIAHVFIETSDKLGELDRTNESCGIYSEACLELCRELDVKAIDLWTAIQKRDDWLSSCFTWVCFHMWYSCVVFCSHLKRMKHKHLIFDSNALCTQSFSQFTIMVSYDWSNITFMWIQHRYHSIVYKSIITCYLNS